MNTYLKAIPVTIIGGYLGSGKTTLVNHILRHANGARLAIMVNDFGELAIDAELIESQYGDVISLSGGCICCSYGDDLSLSLQKLKAQSIQPEHIVIEASGVALPGAIGRSLSLQRSYRLESIVVVADADNVMANAQEKYIGDTITRQLQDADIVVLNKTDLKTTAEIDLLKLWLTEQCPDSSLIEALHCSVESSLLFNITSTDDQSYLHNPLQLQNSSLQSMSAQEHHVSLYSSVSIKTDLAMDVDTLAARLADKNLALIRAKGFVRDKHNVLKTVQIVGRRWSITDAPVEAQSGLVCIAKKDELSEKVIQDLLLECAEASNTDAPVTDALSTHAPSSDAPITDVSNAEASA